MANTDLHYRECAMHRHGVVKVRLHGDDVRDRIYIPDWVSLHLNLPVLRYEIQILESVTGAHERGMEGRTRSLLKGIIWARLGELDPVKTQREPSRATTGASVLDRASVGASL